MLLALLQVQLLALPCPAAVFRQRADREAGSLVGKEVSTIP